MFVQTKVAAEVKKVGSGKGLCQNVGNIVTELDSGDLEFAIGNKFLDWMVFNADVLNQWVLHIIFCELADGIIVAEQKGRV